MAGVSGLALGATRCATTLRAVSTGGCAALSTCAVATGAVATGAVATGAVATGAITTGAGLVGVIDCCAAAVTTGTALELGDGICSTVAGDGTGADVIGAALASRVDVAGAGAAGFIDGTAMATFGAGCAGVGLLTGGVVGLCVAVGEAMFGDDAGGTGTCTITQTFAVGTGAFTATTGALCSGVSCGGAA